MGYVRFVPLLKNALWALASLLELLRNVPVPWPEIYADAELGLFKGSLLSI